MSRSIHVTRKDIATVRRAEYANTEEKRAELKRLGQQLRKKRRIKWRVKEERRHPRLDLLPPVSPNTVPIRILAESEFIHYPASVEDIRGILRRLPPGMLNGLTAIYLDLGTEAQPPLEGCEPDPLTGRLGSEGLPSVYNGQVLGTYRPAEASIRVFAYVYNRETLPEREIFELYLRLQMLSTLVHEIAHHHDYTTRVARGRWLADSKEKKEDYAEGKEYQWVEEYVTAYLKETYPSTVKALDQWLQHWGGLRLSLLLLVGGRLENGQIVRDGVFSSVGAFESLTEDVIQGVEVTQTRLNFALNLRRGDYYEEALEVIHQVLNSTPNQQQALVLQASIYFRQQKYNLALDLALKVVSFDNGNVEVWPILADIYEAKEDWANLLSSTTRAMELIESNWRRWYLLKQRGRAHLHLGNYDGAIADIVELAGNGKRISSRLAIELQEEMRSLPGFKKFMGKE